jgi:hypothetical protein
MFEAGHLVSRRLTFYSANAVLLPPLIRFFGDAFEGFAALFVVHELAAFRAAGRFVAFGVVAGLRIFDLGSPVTEPLRESLPVSFAMI